VLVEQWVSAEALDEHLRSEAYAASSSRSNSPAVRRRSASIM